MDSVGYSLKELVDLLRPDWPSVSGRTIHFYASKGIIGPRRRGRGAKYSELDRLRLLVAVRMRWSGEKVKEIAAQIKSMNQESLEKYVREPLTPLQKLRTSEGLLAYRDPASEGLLAYRDPGDDSFFPRREEQVVSREHRPATWSRIALGDGVELAIRTDVVLREHLPAIIAAFKDLAKRTITPHGGNATEP